MASGICGHSRIARHGAFMNFAVEVGQRLKLRVDANWKLRPSYHEMGQICSHGSRPTRKGSIATSVGHPKGWRRLPDSSESPGAICSLDAAPRAGSPVLRVTGSLERLLQRGPDLRQRCVAARAHFTADCNDWDFRTAICNPVRSAAGEIVRVGAGSRRVTTWRRRHSRSRCYKSAALTHRWVRMLAT